MGENVLLKSQKNEILELIKNQGLDPFNFQWLVEPSKIAHGLYVSRIVYTDSDFFYQFDINLSQHYAIFSPGKEMQIEKKYPGSWKYQKDYVRNWLSYLYMEINQPDLWEEISKYKIPGGTPLGTDISNEPFNFYQVEQIVSGLNQVRAYIKEQKLASEEQGKFINDKLDYLVESAKRQGRKDWIHT